MTQRRINYMRIVASREASALHPSKAKKNECKEKDCTLQRANGSKRCVFHFYKY